jgi:hypothetical protein
MQRTNTWQCIVKLHNQNLLHHRLGTWFRLRSELYWTNYKTSPPPKKVSLLPGVYLLPKKHVLLNHCTATCASVSFPWLQNSNFLSHCCSSWEAYRCTASCSTLKGASPLHLWPTSRIVPLSHTGQSSFLTLDILASFFVESALHYCCPTAPSLGWSALPTTALLRAEHIGVPLMSVISSHPDKHIPSRLNRHSWFTLSNPVGSPEIQSQEAIHCLQQTFWPHGYDSTTWVAIISLLSFL